MALKIGVISPELPTRSFTSAPVLNGSSLFWFNEIEAGFAYLLHDMLDKLYIDQNLIDGSHACTKKYQKLIEQMHPRLEICLANFDAPPMALNNVATFRHFPKLDALFKNGEIKSVYQPIIEAYGKKQAIHGIECLSRVHYNGQYYAPEFIFNYAAEKLKLTNYDKICLMQALTLVPHHKNTLIFINVRPQTLICADFGPWFKSLLKKNQLLPEQIVIEVTEQYCVISEQEMTEQCNNLKNQGIRLAIDDFGAGISNLSMLEVMRPSYIKISGRFIKNSHQDVSKQKIIKNVLELAADFQIAAIVENVELDQEWQQLRALGARLAQGFYFYKPMAREALEALLKKVKAKVTI